MRSSLAVHHPGHHHHHHHSHHHAGSAPAASEAFAAYRPSAGLTAGEPAQPQSRPAGAPVHHASASIDKYREYGGGLGVSRRPRGPGGTGSPGGPHPASEKLRRLLREPRARLQQHLHASSTTSTTTSSSSTTPSGGRAEELHPAMRGVLKPLRTEAVANWIRKTQMSDRDRRAEQELVSSFTRVASGKRELPSSGGHQHRYPRHSKQHAGGDTVPTSSSGRNNDGSSSGSGFRSAYPPPGERAIAALARGTVLRPTPMRMSVAISTQSYTGPVKIPLCGDLRCRVRSCYTWPRMYSCFLSGELRKVGVEIDAVVHSGHPADLKDTNENASRPSVIRTSHSGNSSNAIITKPRDVIVLDDGDDSSTVVVDARPPTSAPAAAVSRHSSHRALAAIRSPLAPPSIRNAIRGSGATQSLLQASGHRAHGSSHSSSRSSSLLARAPSTADPSSAPLELTSPASRLSLTHAVPSSITSVVNPHYLLPGATITSPLALTTLTSTLSSSKTSTSMAFTSTRALDIPPARIDLTSASSLSILSRAPDLPTPRLELTSPPSTSTRAPELTSSHAPPLAVSNRAPSEVPATSRSPPSLSPSAPLAPPSPDEVQDLSSSSGTATSAPATSYRDEEQPAPLLELSGPPRITISCAEGAMTLYRGSESPGPDISVIAPPSV